MPKLRALSFLLALALSALSSIALAQPGTPRRPGPDLAWVTQRLAQQAAMEAPRGRFTRVAQQLAADAPAVQTRQHPQALARFDQLYVRARRLLIDDRARPSDALLDAWDELVVSYAPMRRFAPPQEPNLPPPPPPQALYSFQGSFEQTPVQLTGRTLEELDQSCIRFTSAIDTRTIDDVTIGSQRVHNGPSYWDARALCSIVVLNASAPSDFAPVHATGSIEGIPFAVHGTRDVVARIIEQHVPRVVRGMQVDDVELNGQRYRNGPSFYRAEQIVSLIVAQLPGGPQPIPPGPRPLPPRGPLGAQGTIESVPFSFTGRSAAEIQTQCRAYVASAVSEWIDDIQIDGRPLHNASGWWNVDQVCEIIGNQARPI